MHSRRRGSRSAACRRDHAISSTGAAEVVSWTQPRPGRWALAGSAAAASTSTAFAALATALPLLRRGGNRPGDDPYGRTPTAGSRRSSPGCIRARAVIPADDRIRRGAGSSLPSLRRPGDHERLRPRTSAMPRQGSSAAATRGACSCPRGATTDSVDDVVIMAACRPKELRKVLSFRRAAPSEPGKTYAEDCAQRPLDGAAGSASVPVGVGGTVGSRLSRTSGALPRMPTTNLGRASMEDVTLVLFDRFEELASPDSNVRIIIWVKLIGS